MFLLIFLYPCLHKSEQKYELGTTLIYLWYSETGIYLFIFISLSSNHSFSHIDILNTTPYKLGYGFCFVQQIRAGGWCVGQCFGRVIMQVN